ncbi:hypothetical protein [Pedobacter arcticus]|uniref:hypothetical protein n=1 Tax=Pedobacter arcticus TaxID=752140 RepID=UPI00030FFDBD|nr:hypothetical protein [Pedobacter arcticus]
MTSKKDRQSIQKSKKLIKQQVEETKKLDLGLDADRSSEPQKQQKSIFNGFLNKEELPPLDDK